MVDFTKDMYRGQTSEQTQVAIDSHLNIVIMQATNQAADGCLKNDTAEDKTARIIARDTVLYEIPNPGNQKLEGQTDHHQHLLVNARREANALFERALEKLAPKDKDSAIRVMNFIGEQIFKETLNNQDAHFASSPESLKSSVAELRVSEAKKILSGQIESGAFLKNMALYASNGMQTQCVHKDADVVDYDFAPH